MLVAREVLTFGDTEAAAAAAAATLAAELAAQAAAAADGTKDTETSDAEEDVEEAEITKTEASAADAFYEDQMLLRSSLDAAAIAVVEYTEDKEKRSSVFDARFVPTESCPDSPPALVGCVILTFEDPEAAKLALEQIKPRSQVLGILARTWSEAGSRFQIVPPTVEEVQDNDGLPKPDLAQGILDEEAMAMETECIWDQDIKYGLQESLMSTLQRLVEQFVAAALSIPQTRAFDAVCCVVPGCIAAIADAVMRRSATDHPSAACTHLFGRTSKGKQLGLPGYGLAVGSFAKQTATCLVHAPEVVAARTAVLDYFRR